MWGETPLPSITIFTNGFNLPYIPLKQNLTYNAVAWLGGVWESQVKLNFDLVVTCRDVVGDAVAGALLLHLLVVLIEHVELVVELNFDLVENCRCGGRRLGWCSPSPPTWPTLPPMLSPLCCSFRQ